MLLWISFVDYVKRFATEEALRETEKNEQSSDDESSMSDFSEDDMAKDMELWFHSDCNNKSYVKLTFLN